MRSLRSSVVTIFMVVFAGRIFSAPTASPPAQPAKKLIFLDFENASSNRDYSYLEKSIGESVDELIRKKYTYRKILPREWGAKAKSLGYDNKMLAQEKYVRELGKQLGADGVIFGKFTLENGKIRITGEIFSVIDGEKVGNAEANVLADANMFGEIDKFSQDLAIHIKDLFVPSDRGALWRAAVLPGWGHFYKQKPTWGYFYAIGTGVALAASATFVTLFIITKNQYAALSPKVYTNASGQSGLYEPSTSQAEFDRLEARANTYGQISWIALATTGAFYIANLLHAYFVEPDLGNQAKVSTAWHPIFRSNIGYVSPGLTGSQPEHLYTFGVARHL